MVKCKRLNCSDTWSCSKTSSFVTFAAVIFVRIPNRMSGPWDAASCKPQCICSRQVQATLSALGNVGEFCLPARYVSIWP